MPTTLSAQARRKLDDLLVAYPGTVPKADHPGTVVGIVNKQGEMVYLGASGPNTAGQPEAMAEDAIFAIFSCSKIVTAMAIMHLVENGGLDLDAPVGQWVPALADPDIIVDSTEQDTTTRKAKVPITTRLLLSHTAGFSYSWYNLHLRRWYEQNNLAPGLAGNAPLVNEPGSKFDYGVNMDWAGEVLVAVTGRSLGDYFEEHLFKPLGLEDITFNPWVIPRIEARLATLHAWDAKTDTFAPREYPSKTANGEGWLWIVPFEVKQPLMLVSSAANYLELLKVLLNNGTGTNGAQILKPETVKQMFVNQCAETPDQGALGTNARVESTDARTAAEPLVLLPGVKKGWGLSFLMLIPVNLQDIKNGRKEGSAEWGGIGNLFWLADPTSEVAMVIFNSALPYGMPPFFKLIGDLQDTVYAPGGLVSS